MQKCIPNEYMPGVSPIKKSLPISRQVWDSHYSEPHTNSMSWWHF